MLGSIANAKPLIINVALTGMVPKKADNPSVPMTAEEIASAAVGVRQAGASILHLHAREENGNPTYRKDVYARIIAAVRERCPDVIVCVSTSGRTHKTFAERSEVLELDGDLKPEMASLTLGSLNFPAQASVNEPQMIRALAERMAERGIVAELEIFDLGMIDYAHFLIEQGVLKPPFYFNILLGSLGTLAATPLNLATTATALPKGSVWAGAGIGRFQLTVNAQAIAMGGHVRVGLEDNLWMDAEKTKPATNQALVERLTRVAQAIERPLATPAEARKLIGLPPPKL